ncbi:Para-hydroxybenzoate--polyprenyltransferase, mitochondrial precursor (PHB:polyprenyltransferase) [Thelotrema lepadinum]|nr:Para-hydroxybenzoate--polyprenyltransferase, mitochondrial precursor (PHB:polyprenyltransferase) [Thelotrema lepadinum]
MAQRTSLTAKAYPAPDLAGNTSRSTIATPSEMAEQNSSQWLVTTLEPFAQLVRLSKPIGVIIINFPYIHGLYYAAAVSTSSLSFSQVFLKGLQLTFGTFWLRSWACAWNDVVDRDLDRLVTRCHNRPMARGAISARAGYLFTIALTFVWYVTMNYLLDSFHIYGPPLLLLASIYPYTKRFMDHTPVFLGFTFAWGILIGSSAGGLDPLYIIYQRPSAEGIGLAALFGYFVIWTTIFETVYAFQDIEDDTKAGIRSMAVRYRDDIRRLLGVLALLEVALLIVLGVATSASKVFYVFCPLTNSLLLIYMVKNVQFGDPQDCGWWFRNGPLMAGISTSIGLLGNCAW